MNTKQINEEKTLLKNVKSDLTNENENPIAAIGEVFSQNMPKADINPTDFLDPDLYDIQPDGKPRLNRYGKPAKKKGRPRKHGEKITGRDRFTKKVFTEAEIKQKQEDKAAQIEKNKQHSKAIAMLCVDMSINAAVNAFGDEWKPSSEGEKDMLIGATAEYFASKGVTDLPPGVALVMVVSAYALPRLAQPKTMTKLQKLKLFFTEKIGGLSGKKQPVKIPPRSEAEKE